jgi:tRNA 5-methylaminomethyl-2-thiouridine biosynthesis bifunctional protein
MDAQAPLLTPLACDLPKTWAKTPAWRILDTQFEAGQAFLGAWQLWRDDPNRPRLLHFVGLAPTAPSFDDLRSLDAHHPEWCALLDELAPHWFGLLPGFHRISLDDGRVLLTLCIGPLSEQLRQQHFYADTVYLGIGEHNAPEPWDTWTTKALARCCRRGTVLWIRHPQPNVQAILAQCGFVFNSPDTNQAQCAVFDPRWDLKKTRSNGAPASAQVGTCAVIGAGLAGASVAASLARRGWQVTVLDGAAAPASGASGLPVGLVAPHDSVDDCKLSRLTRAGVRLTLNEAARHLEEAQEWALSGSTEYRFDGGAGLPEHWSMQGEAWSRAIASSQCNRASSDFLARGAEVGVSAIWHAHSAWIKPALLVRAWLSLPHITFLPNAHVATMSRVNDQWLLVGTQGQPLASVDRVVFANATGAFSLLQQVQKDGPQHSLHLNRLPAVHGVRGQLSFGRHENAKQAAFPVTPINGAGSVIPHIPTEKGLSWFVGSSFQPETQPAFSPEQNHQSNFGRLQTLNPELASQLQPQFEGHHVQHWGNTRCVTADRLPLVGAVGEAQDSGLWLCAGMGARGLSFSVLCAELLAAQWSGEPLPVEFNLAQSFNALRLTTRSVS